MDDGMILSIAGVATLIALAGVSWWAFTPANRQRFEGDALLPLQTDPFMAPEGMRAGEKSK
jgi:cytochrome c oxidase cbb3-type subunit 4